MGQPLAAEASSGVSLMGSRSPEITRAQQLAPYISVKTTWQGHLSSTIYASSP